MIDNDLIQKAHERREVNLPGVTLVAFYGDPKPAGLLALIRNLQDGMARTVAGHPGLFCPYEDGVHATICGMEGRFDANGEIITQNMSDRGQQSEEPIRPVAIQDLLEHIRGSRWPIRFQFGGYLPGDNNPHDRDREPWERSFAIRPDGLAVIVAWSLGGDGTPFSLELDNWRRGLHRYGVVHKYHTNPDDVDNDLFMVLGGLNDKVWRQLSAAEQQAVHDQLNTFQRQVRESIQLEPLVVDLTPEQLWVVKYRRTTLEDVTFAGRITEITERDIRSLYTYEGLAGGGRSRS